MKKIALGFAAALLSAASAGAADLPSRKAPPLPPPPPLFSWTGVYVGANIGGGWLDRYNVAGWSNTWNGFGWWPVYALNGNNTGSGVVGGGQIGYNYQVSPLFVVGIETDIQGTSIGGGNGGGWWGSATRSVSWFGTVRGRLGVSLFKPELLFYGTGGFAYGDVKLNLPIFNGFRQTATGWTVGGGAEYAFLQNWSAKVEYLYTNLGATYSGAPSAQHRVHMHTVRAGLNWRLGWLSAPPAPVLAKY
ncbi:outer membrane beta-barrel protein [Methylocystis sp. 9N]|uniref:Outer membrane beta-barrel protein n=1 Tax=Methylocystis borbori TaxID=3118750 RepID=A0ABU7XF81_9HYPH